MATLSDSLVSSSARRLPLRRRPDLQAKQQKYQGRVYWIVKDPVGLNYYRFQEEEFAILNMLDGNSSLDQIRDRFEAKFPPQKITLQELQQFLGTLHRSGLVIADVPGQGPQLKKRRDERWRKELLNMASNLLSLRFKGVDPERFLDWLYPYVRWFFTKAAATCFITLGLAAVTLILVQFSVFQSKLPEFNSFFTLENAKWMAVVLGCTKILHELGHGMSCKHFGGECHEIGVMFLVLTPCLYCNVSDSWMLPNKWHRAFIGAAGMYVELCLATIATFLWWFSEPGWLNHICLNVMFVSSVSTVVFNANPLLRYDGYYILSDIVEIPNLRQKATTILGRKLGAWCLGLEEPDDPFLPQRNQWFFVVYSIAAAVYRWLVLFGILWFLNEVFKPYRLQIIGQAIAAMSVIGLVVQPLWKVGKFFYVPGRADKVKKPRLYASLGVVAALLAAIVYVPLPHHVLATLEIRAQEAATVYADVTAKLEEVFVKPGQRVAKGDKLARLSSVDIELQIAELSGNCDMARTKIENLKYQYLRFNDPTATSQIAEVEKQLDGCEKQLQEKQSDLAKLNLVAPRDGVVIPWPDDPRPHGEGQLPLWTGSALLPRNRGVTLHAGTPFCQIIDPTKMEGVVVVDQGDREFIKAHNERTKEPGSEVEILLNALPNDRIAATIHEIASKKVDSQDMKFALRNLSNKVGGELQTEVDEAGEQRPLSTMYQARVLLDNTAGLLRPGLTGHASIDAGTMPLGRRLWRYLGQTFNFRL